MNNVLIMGGFTESQRVLQPVAEEAVAQKFGQDADVLTLRDALHMDGEQLRMRMAGKSVIAHSAAVLAIPDATQALSSRELPQDMAIVAAPEPRPVAWMAVAATRKTVRHLFSGEQGFRAAHLRVAAGNIADSVAHPFVNGRIVPEASRFSTRGQLAKQEIAASRRLGYYMMSSDEFYADPNWPHSGLLHALKDRGQLVAELFGSHDELLTDPEGVLKDITDIEFANL